MEIHDPLACHPLSEPLLVVVPSVPAARLNDGLFLDEKAVAGLKLYASHWPGRVRCVFREGPTSVLPFGKVYDPNSLPFEVSVLPAAAPVPDALLSDAAIVLGSGDNHLNFPLAKRCRALGVPLAFVIEYIPETRLQIIALSNATLIKRLKSMAWAIQSEFRRLRAFKTADALQANGTPAAKRYARSSRDLSYFDTRLSKAMLASKEHINAKEVRLAAGAPLRLVFTGRLERMKGADHLIPVAERLLARGVNFRLDVFGVGSLAGQMREMAARRDLAGSVFIHGPLDFAEELVPRMRTEFDLFVCCHRQSDPSCTYMETLGCGVPIIGYRNRAFSGILELGDVGWSAGMNDLDAMADGIAKINRQRKEISIKAAAAIALASEHNFEATFERRVIHLHAIALRDQAAT